MNSSITWLTGDRALGYQVERVLNEGSEASGELVVLRDNPRRRIVTVQVGGRRVLVKHFRVGSGRHALRDHWKAWLGRAPARREWRALRAMRRAGVPVPEPWVLGTLADGDHLLVMEHLSGTPLDQALRRDAVDPRAGLAALGGLVAKIHAAGWIHGDLHSGNLLYDNGEWAFLDWQHAHRSEARRARRADAARLEYSLARFLPLGQRMRLREAALSVTRPYDPVARAALREAGEALWERFDEHARSRTRRALRPGRRFQQVELPGLAGLRTGALSDPELRRVLAAHDATRARPGDPSCLKDDPRSCVTAVAFAERRLIVKEFPRRVPVKWLGDLARGTPARRAWLAGHGLLARRIGAALPYAYLEERRVRPRSWVVLEDLRPATASTFAIERGVATPSRLADALLRLVLQLHRRGVDHGDLKSTHILLRRRGRGGALEACLIDLEGVRFRRRIAWRRRRRSLVQLNASLPDTLSAALRRHFWVRYLQIFPVAGDPERAARGIVRASLARAHRWTGRDCDWAPGSAASRPSVTPSSR